MEHRRTVLGGLELSNFEELEKAFDWALSYSLGLRGASMARTLTQADLPFGRSATGAIQVSYFAAGTKGNEIYMRHAGKKERITPRVAVDDGTCDVFNSVYVIRSYRQRCADIIDAQFADGRYTCVDAVTGVRRPKDDVPLRLKKLKSGFSFDSRNKKFRFVGRDRCVPRARRA